MWGSLGHHRWLQDQFPQVFSVLHYPLGLDELQACPFPDVLPPLLLSALISSPIHCALQCGFSQTWLMGNMSIPLQFAFLYDGRAFFGWSDCLLDLGMHFVVGNCLCIRCVVTCGSTSFPWLAFFFAALLWGSMVHMHTVRWMWQGSTSVIFWNWEKCFCRSKLVSTLWMLLSSVYSGEYFRLGTLVSRNWVQVLEAVVWSCFLFIRSGQNHLARHSERGKKTRPIKEEVGRQH